MQQKFKQPHLNTTLAKKHKKMQILKNVAQTYQTPLHSMY
jgi:hypothetical protein